MGFRYFIAVICLVTMAGCSSYYTREFTLDEPGDGKAKAISMDIRQRMLIVGTRQSKNDENQTIHTSRICAEPSPDAMSAVSGSFSAGLMSDPERALELANSFNESAAFVGLRTPTIQLLRDGMYRLCEGYLSGALTEFQYQWLMRRYQRNMVGLLAIESLTATVRAPSVLLTSNSSAQIGQSIARLEEQLEATRNRLDALQKELDDLADDEPDKKEKLEKDIKRYQKTQASIEAAIANGQSAIAKGGTSGSIQAPVTNISEVKVAEVTKTIEKIMDKIYSSNDFDGVCMEGYLAAKDKNELAMISSICDFENRTANQLPVIRSFNDNPNAVVNQRYLCQEHTLRLMNAFGDDFVRELCTQFFEERQEESD